MNSHGVFHSSTHVNEVSKACVLELRNIADLAWDSLKRAHQSCGSKTSEDLLALFSVLLLAERTKMEQVQESELGGIAGQLLNKELISTQVMSAAYADLLRKYKIEVEIYISSLQQGAGVTLFERVRSRLLNHKLIVIVVIAAAVIVALAAFTDAINKLLSIVKAISGAG